MTVLYLSHKTKMTGHYKANKTNVKHGQSKHSKLNSHVILFLYFSEFTIN